MSAMGLALNGGMPPSWRLRASWPEQSSPGAVASGCSRLTPVSGAVRRVALLFNAQQIYDREIIAGIGDYFRSTRVEWDVFVEEEVRHRPDALAGWRASELTELARLLARLADDFSAGPPPRPLAPAGVPALQPLICYEAVFPGDITTRDDRPGWIVNLTNDGWFGISTGPYQHLQQTRMRAVEQGLPIVRAANTGVSGLVAPSGAIGPELPLGRRGTLRLEAQLIGEQYKGKEKLLEPNIKALHLGREYALEFARHGARVVVIPDTADLLDRLSALSPGVETRLARAVSGPCTSNTAASKR